MKKEINCNITREIAVLSSNQNRWQLELNEVAWNDGTPKLEIRRWAPNHEKCNRRGSNKTSLSSGKGGNRMMEDKIYTIDELIDMDVYTSDFASMDKACEVIGTLIIKGAAQSPAVCKRSVPGGHEIYLGETQEGYALQSDQFP